MLKTGDFRTYDVRGDGILAQKSGRTVYVIRHEGVKETLDVIIAVVLKNLVLVTLLNTAVQPPNYDISGYRK